MQWSRPGRIDVAAAALLALAGATEHAAAAYERWPLGLAAYAAAAAVLVLARTAPLLLPPLVAAVYALTPLAGFDVSQPASWIPLLAASFFACGLYAPPARRLAGLAAVLLALAVVYAGLALLTPFEPSLLFGLAMSLGPWGLGLGLRTALERERRAGAEAERARAEREGAHERALAAERGRIAAELQDVLAHALGAMVLQAAAAGDLVSRDGRAAARVLEGVAGAGREALAETGRLLRVLREEQPGREPAKQEPAVGPRLHPRDAALPALFASVATAEIVGNGYGPLWAMLGAVWLAGGVLAGRRVLPLAMPVAVIALLLAPRLVGARPDELASSILIGGLAFFAAGRHVPRDRLALGAAAVGAGLGLLALDLAARGELSADAVLLLAFGVGPWAVGVALRAALARAREHAAVAEREQLEGEAEAAGAVAADRRRIARELHDLLASSLSVMSVQAAVAAESAAADPPRAAAAVREVERAGRAALADTGRLLRLVHGDRDGDAMHPQPGVGDLPALAEDCARAGLEVELESDDLGRVPAGVDVSAYRIVQEALTNALRHAPGSRVCVRLERSSAAVAVEVVNGRPRAPLREPVPSGHGLAGLRERVALYGGTLEARPTADGGFALAATIPLEETA